jgi:hypothetical protein
LGLSGADQSGVFIIGGNPTQSGAPISGVFHAFNSPCFQDPHPQTFAAIPDAKPDDFQKANEQVFRDRDASSGVGVMVLPQ